MLSLPIPLQKVVSNIAVSSSALILDFVLDSFHLGKKSMQLVFSFVVHASFLPFPTFPGQNAAWV